MSTTTFSEIIENSLDDAVQAITFLKSDLALNFIETAAHAMASAFKKGNKLIIAGNGGSLCDAMHFAEEMTGQYREKRRALPAIALSEAGHLTCVANDFGYDEVFARGVEAYGKEGDIFIALTTSGNSANIVNAVERAKKMGLVTVTFLGKSGGVLKGKSDFELLVPGFVYSDRIQEAHMTAIHIIIDLIEKELFES